MGAGYLVVRDGEAVGAAWRSNAGEIGERPTGQPGIPPMVDFPEGIADDLDSGVYKIDVGKWRRGSYEIRIKARLDEPAAEAERLAKLAGVAPRTARSSRPGIAVSGTGNGSGGRYTYSDLARASSSAAENAKRTTARLAGWLDGMVAP